MKEGSAKGENKGTRGRRVVKECMYEEKDS
jgi:hypothetical protein